jgi:hypothetical protein
MIEETSLLLGTEEADDKGVRLRATVKRVYSIIQINECCRIIQRVGVEISLKEELKGGRTWKTAIRSIILSTKSPP